VTDDRHSVCVLIPAHNEASRIASTIEAVRSRREVDCVIVVDDGSTDDTAEVARKAGADQVIRQKNKGKGAAMAAGYAAAPETAGILVLLDADLGASAAECVKLIRAVQDDSADMAIGILPPDPDFAASGQIGGLGTVTRVANWAIRRRSETILRQPLSGQRAVRRSVLEKIGPKFGRGYGAEVALTIATLQAGCRIIEVETHFRHRVSGGDLAGWLHRFRQLIDVTKAAIAS
jgi:glycosyltransferase involved in cell wall biosynthesis